MSIDTEEGCSQPFTMQKNRAWLCAFAISIAFSLSACGGEEVSCSSENTRQVVQDIVKRQVRNSPWAYWINPEETKVKLESVVTKSSTGKNAECEAHLEFDLSTNPEYQEVQSPFGLLKPYEFEATLEQNQASDVRYRVDKTDDGKQLLVKLSGLKPWR